MVPTWRGSCPSSAGAKNSSPAAFRGKGEEAVERRLRGHREVDVLGGVPGRAVQLIEQGGARRARSLGQGEQRGLAARRTMLCMTRRQNALGLSTQDKRAASRCSVSW